MFDSFKKWTSEFEDWSYDSSDLHVVRAIRIDFQKCRISDEIISRVIKLSHITSKHERGLCYRPQCHLNSKPKECKTHPV